MYLEDAVVESLGQTTDALEGFFAGVGGGWREGGREEGREGGREGGRGMDK